MKRDRTHETYREIKCWANGSGSLTYLMEMLGDKDKHLADMLVENDLVRGDLMPNPQVSPDTTIGCIMLYLAMRHG